MGRHPGNFGPGLNGPADRYEIQSDQFFKGRFQIRPQAVQGGRFFLQGDQPVPLALSADILEYLAGGHHGIDAGANGRDGRLKPLEISLGSEFDDTPAVTAAVPLQRDDGVDAVKTGIHKSVPPQLGVAAPGAMRRPGPRKIFR